MNNLAFERIFLPNSRVLRNSQRLVFWSLSLCCRCNIWLTSCALDVFCWLAGLLSNGRWLSLNPRFIQHSYILSWNIRFIRNVTSRVRTWRSFLWTSWVVCLYNLVFIHKHRLFLDNALTMLSMHHFRCLFTWVWGCLLSWFSWRKSCWWMLLWKIAITCRMNLLPSWIVSNVRLVV